MSAAEPWPPAAVPGSAEAAALVDRRRVQGKSPSPRPEPDRGSAQQPAQRRAPQRQLVHVVADADGEPPAFGGADPLPHEPRSELGYAHRLVHVHGDRLRHVRVWNRWLVWDGQRWAADTTGEAQRRAKSITRLVRSDLELIGDDQQRRAALREARGLESASGIAGMLSLASTEPGIALAPEQLDDDPWLLNCTNGVLDLRTLELGPHDPALHLTRLAGAAYDPEARGDGFAAFLERIQPDRCTRDYLARLLGQALPGIVLEHLLPIFCGTGANGKSTLLDAVAGALGNYASPADPGLFTERGYEAHPTGVADLFGRRLVLVHEGDRGRYLAEGTVKRLTGGDKVKARRMREDFWEFTPSHSAVMLTNHRPQVRGDDEGIWRRLRVVPFDVVIPDHERDVELGERLRLERDAVLAWLVNGLRDWRARGLADPDAVTAATRDYRSESDTLGRFIAERCLLGPYLHAGARELFEAWTAYCAAENVPADTQHAFGRALHVRGLENKKDSTGRKRWHGIALSTTETD